MREQRPTGAPRPGEQSPRYERDEVAVPIDTTFYTNTEPAAGDDGAEAAAEDTGTTSSSPIDVQRLEAEIAEADRLLSPEGEQELKAAS